MCFTGCLSDDKPKKWRKARKKPIVIEFREVEGEKEAIQTREGWIVGYKDKDYIIRGVRGEVYPIDKNIFAETYEIL